VSERYDAVVIGLGPGGEVAAGRLLAAGKRVAVAERELIGGECAYWACIPSKTLLRATEARAAAGRVAGMDAPSINWPALRDYRDYMVRHLDDASQIEGYTTQGATVVKGDARITGPGTVEVGDRVLEADHVIVATGSEPLRPPIEGLDDAQVWTNREATTLREVPGRVVVLGGSAVGVELGQFLSRMGARVSIVEAAERLVPREHHRVGELTRTLLEADGIDVHTGAAATRVLRSGATTTVEVQDGTHLDTDVVLLATGRRPRTAHLGLDTVGVEVDERGAIVVDEHCRAGEGLWALGDVTGVALFTHVAMYQARVVADNLLGHNHAARYEGIPRVVFSDPEVAAVGLSGDAARSAGIATIEAEVDLADAIARPWTYERDPAGTLGVVADRERRRLRPHPHVGRSPTAATTPKQERSPSSVAGAPVSRQPTTAMAEAVRAAPVPTRAVGQVSAAQGCSSLAIRQRRCSAPPKPAAAPPDAPRPRRATLTSAVSTVLAPTTLAASSSAAASSSRRSPSHARRTGEKRT
jgi:pyruvate/2-oxoglutarate dehydrogenase complex dihydrolipoamide dehydrogenase (E3) component